MFKILMHMNQEHLNPCCDKLINCKNKDGITVTKTVNSVKNDLKCCEIKKILNKD